MGKQVIEDATAIEHASGSLITELGATLLAAFSANPVVAVLPVLTNALASGRHRERVERAISRLSAELSRQETKLREISDSQYKLINEAVLAIFSTLEIEKLEYLRRAAENALDATEIKPHEAVVLARVIRDLSAEEVRFLLKHHLAERIQVSTTPPSREGLLHVDPDSADGLVASGLSSIGLLMQSEPTWDDSGLLRWSPLVRTLVGLFQAPNNALEQARDA